MNVQKFTAPTIDAALMQVKSKLGREAVILHTRSFRRGGLFGLGSREVVEVTASDQVRVSTRDSQAQKNATALAKVYRQRAGSSQELLSLKSDIGGIRAMIEELTRQTRPSRTHIWPEALKYWYKHLCQRGVSEESAIEVLEPLAPALSGAAESSLLKVKELVSARLAELLNTAAPALLGKPGRPMVVALVGPTGVGKTTTIAKLAAHFVLREKRPVGLVTLDTYRIAAVEQLRTYARIIDVPLEVALRPADLPRAIERLEGCSVVFVDTAGRSQRDLMKMNDLKTFFALQRPDEIHLVLSAAAEASTLADIIDRFSMYKPDRLVLTKLDELPACGRLLDISRTAPLPVSYVTTGQDVPDDIETACPRRLAALISGEAGLDG